MLAQHSNDRNKRAFKQCCGVSFVFLAGIIAAGCGSILLNRLNSDVRSSAILYAEELKNSGVLPGFASGEHGEMILDDALGVLAHVGIKYPLDLTVKARKLQDKENAIYAYLLSKESPDSEWKLIGACKRLKGKNIWYMDMREPNKRHIDELVRGIGGRSPHATNEMTRKPCIDQ